MGMANYQVQAPDGSMHIIQGPDDATPADIEANAPNLVPKADPTPFPADDPTKTYGSVLPIARDNTTGDLSLAAPEMIRSPARGLLGLVGRAGGEQQAATEDNPNPNQTLSGDELNALMLIPGKSIASAPATASAALDLGNVASQLMSKAGDNPTMAQRAAAGEVETAPATVPKAPATLEGTMATRDTNYAGMRANNEAFPVDKAAAPITSAIDKLMEPPAVAGGKLGPNQQSLNNTLNSIRGMITDADGAPQPMDGTAIDKVGRELNMALQNPENINPVTGGLNENGRAIAKVRGAVQDILNNDQTTGSVHGANARSAASTVFTVDPIDSGLQAADLTPTNANGYRVQAAKLVKDSDYFDRLSPTSQAMLTDAATQSLTRKIIGGQVSHLVTSGAGIVAGLTFGGEAGVATGLGMEAGKVALDVAAAKAVRAKIMAVRQNILEEGAAKQKPIPATPNAPAPLRLTGPGSVMNVDKLGNVAQANSAHQIVNTQPQEIAPQLYVPPRPEAPPQLLLPAPGKATMSNDEAAAAAAQLRAQPASGDSTLYGGNRPPNRFGHVTPFTDVPPTPTPVPPLQGLNRAGEGLPPNYTPLADNVTPQSIAERLRNAPAAAEVAPAKEAPPSVAQQLQTPEKPSVPSLNRPYPLEEGEEPQHVDNEVEESALNVVENDMGIGGELQTDSRSARMSFNKKREYVNGVSSMINQPGPPTLFQIKRVLNITDNALANRVHESIITHREYIKNGLLDGTLIEGD